MVLVTDPEIVEEAYAFDNPCFKDVTATLANRTREGPVSVASGDTPGKDSVRWSTSWTSLGLGSTNRNDKRKTLDDSCLGVSAFLSISFSAIQNLPLYGFTCPCNSSSVLLKKQYHYIIFHLGTIFSKIYEPVIINNVQANNNLKCVIVLSRALSCCT